jgi:hypothetical protein
MAAIGPESQGIEIIAQWLTASTTWAALAGDVYEVDSDDATPAGAYAIVDVEGAADITVAGRLAFDGTVTVRVEMLWPDSTDPLITTKSGMVQWARNTYSAIRADILDQADAGQIQSVGGDAPIKLDKSTGEPDWWSSSLLFTLYAQP